MCVRTIPPLLTTAQVAKLCYCSPRTVDNLRIRGTLDAIPLGSQHRFPADQPYLARFLVAARVVVAA